MKKRLLCSFLIAISVTGLALVSSCKDYDDYSDLRTQSKIDHTQMWNAINGNTKSIDSLRTRLDTLKMCEVNCDSLKKVIDTLTNDVRNLIDTIAGDSNSVLGRFNLMNQKVNAVKGTADSAKQYNDSIDTVITRMRHELDSIMNIADYDTVPLFDSVKVLKKSIHEVDSVLHVYIDSIRYNSRRIDTIKLRVDTLEMRIDTLKLRIDTLEWRVDTLELRVDTLEQRVDTLEQRVDTLELRVDTLELRVDTLELRVDSLMDAERRRITSLYVQGTVNPTFGSFALPVGIRSNILSCYYGEALNNVTFPATANDADLSAVLDPGMELSAAELAVIGTPTQTSISQGNTIISDSANNAGRIFLTINPNEVQIDPTYKFSFVNSLGDQTPVVFDALKPSQEKLTFGLSNRAAANTGFYEAGIKIEESAASQLAPNISVTKEQLKNIAKDIIDYKDGFNLSGIAGAVFKLAETSLDANAVRVEWTDSLGDHSVTSQYDVAVTAIQPLSYSAGQGVGTSRRLPTISPLTDLSISLPTTYHMDLGTVSFDVSGVTSTISFDHINIGYPDPSDVSITVDVPVGTPGRGADGKKTYNADGLNNLIDDINEAFNDPTNGVIVKWSGNVNATINQIISDIKTAVDNLVQTQLGAKLDVEVNKMLTDVKTSINNSLSGYNSYFNKMNSLISRINAVTSRINSKLDLDVNAILQPVILYEANDGSLHPMSNDPAHPSKFTAAGGGIVLYPTSYTGELLAPAYQKFIAVVDGPGVAVSNINSGEYYNTPIDGKRYAIPFAPTTTGTYTIYYSAVDYSGVVTAQRFYVTVE